MLNMPKNNLATKDDIKSIRSDLKNFATKDDIKSIRSDLKNFATKDDIKSIRSDLKNFATKDDIKSIRSDLKNFATKDSLDQTNNVLLQLDDKVDRLHGELRNEMVEKFDDVMDALDKQSKILINLNHEVASHSISYKQHEEVLDDHERRIGLLETPVVA